MVSRDAYGIHSHHILLNLYYMYVRLNTSNTSCLMKVGVWFTVISCKATTACSGCFDAEATIKQETVWCYAAVHNIDCRGNLRVIGERSSVGGGSMSVRANVSVSVRARERVKASVSGVRKRKRKCESSCRSNWKIKRGCMSDVLKMYSYLRC
jgi:hypothetical protein